MFKKAAAQDFGPAQAGLGEMYRVPLAQKLQLWSGAESKPLKVISSVKFKANKWGRRERDK